MTQQEFSELVGISKIFLQQVEGGKYKLSEKVAQLIEHETGARAQELMRGPNGKVVDGKTAKPYTMETWKRRRDELTDTAFEPEKYRYALLYLASVLSTAKANNSFERVFSAVIKSLDQTKKTNNYGELTTTIIDRFRQDVKKLLPMDLVQRMDDIAQKAIQEHDAIHRAGRGALLDEQTEHTQLLERYFRQKQ